LHKPLTCIYHVDGRCDGPSPKTSTPPGRRAREDRII
jgi:hypothetical protein